MAVPKSIQRLFDQLLHEEPGESGTAFSGPLASLMMAKIGCEDLLEVGDKKAKRAARELLKVFTEMLDSYVVGKKVVENLYTTAAEHVIKKDPSKPKRRAGKSVPPPPRRKR